jgi:hypothetical protein
MKRLLVVLLVLGLAAGALAPAQAAKKKKKAKKPVPVDLTYNVVWSDEVCALSTGTELFADQSCGDPFAGSTTGDLSATGEPVVFTAIDGLPLTLDASKPVKGSFEIGSYTLAALADNGLGQPLGAGEAEWHIVLAGTAGDEIVTLGEVTTEPYTVAPGTGSYPLTFEITPPAGLTGKVLDTLSLSMEQVGSATLHGAVSTDGTSKLTLGAFAVPKK